MDQNAPVPAAPVAPEVVAPAMETTAPMAAEPATPEVAMPAEPAAPAA